MTEAVTAPEAPPAAPPPAEAPAEVVASDSQKPAESATAEAPESEKPEKPSSPDEEKRGTRRFERRISQAIRRAAEARAEADVLRRQMEELRQSQAKTASDPDEPKLEAFSDIAEYGKALKEHATRKVQAEFEAKRQSESQRQFIERLTTSWEEQVEKFSEEHEDFEEKVGKLSPVNPLTVAIMRAKNGARVAYHLASNPDEARRIAALVPIEQAIEIGELSAKLAAAPAKPKTPSKAPAPITPVGGKSGGANDLPQDTDDINTWMQKERAREKKLRSG